jgi:hypothetical protein
VKRKPFTPRAYHDQVIRHLANNERCNLFAKPGMGKTTMAATFLDYLHNIWGESAPTLVLAPKRVAIDTWPADFAKWDHLADLQVATITGTVAERTAALRRDVPVFTTNYENLIWLIDHLADAGHPWPFRTVIADESTKLKGFRLRQGGARAQALAKVAHKHVDRWINLTGTPASNGLVDLWGQQWFVDEGRALGRTFTSFQDRWFGFRNVKDPRTGKTYTERFAFPHAQDDIQAAIGPVSLTLDPRDWFDLREPIVNVIEVELPASARSKYREMERDLFTMIGTTEVEAQSAAAKSMKCLQCASGAMYLDAERYGQGTWVEIHFEKLDALSELIDETGDDPLLVMYQFKSDLARLQKAFPYALNLALAADMGKAKAGEGKLWLGHPASMGHGVDGLQEHCNRIVFFSQDWNLEYHDQALERVGPMRQLQSGKDREVFVDYIVARGTIDEVVMARRDSKRSVQDALLDYLKGKQ